MLANRRPEPRDPRVVYESNYTLLDWQSNEQCGAGVSRDIPAQRLAWEFFRNILFQYT